MNHLQSSREKSRFSPMERGAVNRWMVGSTGLMPGNLEIVKVLIGKHIALTASGYSTWGFLVDDGVIYPYTEALLSRLVYIDGKTGNAGPVEGVGDAGIR